MLAILFDFALDFFFVLGHKNHREKNQDFALG